MKAMVVIPAKVRPMAMTIIISSSENPRWKLRSAERQAFGPQRPFHRLGIVDIFMILQSLKPSLRPTAAPRAHSYAVRALGYLLDYEPETGWASNHSFAIVTSGHTFTSMVSLDSPLRFANESGNIDGRPTQP